MCLLIAFLYQRRSSRSRQQSCCLLTLLQLLLPQASVLPSPTNTNSIFFPIWFMQVYLWISSLPMSSSHDTNVLLTYIRNHQRLNANQYMLGFFFFSFLFFRLFFLFFLFRATSSLIQRKYNSCRKASSVAGSCLCVFVCVCDNQHGC